MATYEHTVISGQSLSVGHSGSPGISTVAENAAQEPLTDGTLGPSEIDHDPTADQPGRERPQFSLGYRLHEARTGAGVNTLVSTDGQGGSTIDELSKGGSTGEYEALVTRVTNTRAARLAASDTYSVRALHWIQGETDQFDGTSRQDYYDALVALRADYATDLATPDLPMIASQTSTVDFTWVNSSEQPLAPLAQLDAHRELDWFTLVGPHYAYPRAVDDLHLLAPSYYYVGELHARASLAAINGAGWDPLMPTNAVSDGQTIVVTFAVPVAPLVLDTTTVAAQPNYGFSVHDTAAQIADVALGSDGISVEITLDRPVTTTIRLGYAVGPDMDTSRGNLRDSETAVSAYDGAALPNWSVLFLETVPPPQANSVYRARSADGLRLVRADGGRLPIPTSPQ